MKTAPRKKQQSAKPAPPSLPPRLQKVLAQAGYGSRRACEQLICEGRVEIDRCVANELGVRVDPERQEVRVDGEVVRPPRLAYFAVNKPEGVVTTNRDPSRRPRVIDLVRGGENMFAVGRLDMSSSGLILVTNDGDFANRVAHPRYGVDKTYRVVVAGAPPEVSLGYPAPRNVSGRGPRSRGLADGKIAIQKADDDGGCAERGSQSRVATHICPDRK